MIYSDIYTEDKTLEALVDKQRLKGYELSIPSLDRLVGGIRPSTLTVLTASTGMGKSLLSLNIANDLTENNNKVFYVELENGIPLTLSRLIQIKYSLPTNFTNNNENKDQLSKMIKEIQEAGFSIMDSGYLTTLNYTVKGIKALLAVFDLKIKEGVKVFIIDPLQALERQISSNDSYQEQGDIVKQLKDYAQKNNVSIIINHHIRKGVNGGGKYVLDIEDIEETKYRIPTLEDLKGSSKITDYATDVWALVRTKDKVDIHEKGMTLFRVLKSRTRDSGTIKLWLDLATLRFFEYKEKPEYIRGDVVPE